MSTDFAGVVDTVAVGAPPDLGRTGASWRPRPVGAFAQAALGGSIRLGAAYGTRAWDVDDLVGLLRRLYRWTRPFRFLESVGANLAERRRGAAARSAGTSASAAGHEVQAGHEGPAGQEVQAAERANVAHHYDLPPEWFALFLDETMSYSCALFDGDSADVDVAGSFAQAAARKLGRLCDLLKLDADSHLLDIGCGWGALTLAAADGRGAKVTATTISTRQRHYVEDEVRRLGLDHQVRVVGDHYADLTGSYDAVASVEMIEALDWSRQRDFLAAGHRLLAPGGRFVLQAITIQDFHYHRVKRHEDFIKRYIFPGGCLPSRRSLEQAAQAVGLEIVDMASIGTSYPPTLAAWRHNLDKNWSAARSLGLSDSFLRMWRFYLAYCEAGFREGYLDDYRLLLRRH